MAEQDNSKLFGILGIALTWIGFIIVKVAQPKDEYANYYGAQGLVLGITWIAVFILNFILGMSLGFMGMIGVMLSGLISTVLGIGIFILWIIGIINAASGEMKPLPILGGFADKF